MRKYFNSRVPSKKQIEDAYEYCEFGERKEKENCLQVIENNPGIQVGGSNLAAFGGMSYDAWKRGKKFERGMEARHFTCPAWWYQLANCDLKPGWAECISIGSFNKCSSFHQKEKCWKQFDEEREE